MVLCFSPFKTFIKWKLCMIFVFNLSNIYFKIGQNLKNRNNNNLLILQKTKNEYILSKTKSCV